MLRRELHRNISTGSTGSACGVGFDFTTPGGYKISEALAWVIIESIGEALSFIHDKGIFALHYSNH